MNKELLQYSYTRGSAFYQYKYFGKLALSTEGNVYTSYASASPLLSVFRQKCRLMCIERLAQGFSQAHFCTNKNCKQPKLFPLGRRESTVTGKSTTGVSRVPEMFYVLTWVGVTWAFSCLPLRVFLYMFGIFTKHNLKYI